MSCFKSFSKARFSVRFTTSRKLKTEPILEGSKKSCGIQSEDERQFNLELSGADFSLCGVRPCNDDQDNEQYCLTLRFQAVAGLLLADDTTLKIECKAHKPTADHLGRFTVPIEENRRSRHRSPSIFARGGDPESEMESEISFLRKQGNQFTKAVEPGATLQLGEELMIKSAVQSKNPVGWQFSRMSDVVAHRSSTWKNNVDDNSDDTVVIVDTDGCRNPALNAVCPADPVQDEEHPLISTVILRVFMMEGMEDGDELEISIRTTACMEHEDCYTDCQSKQHRTRRPVRAKRRTHEKTADKNKRIYFRIGIPRGTNFSNFSLVEEPTLQKDVTIFTSFIFFMIVAIFLIIKNI